MAHNLRSIEKEGQTYVNVTDLLKLMVDVISMDGIHPIAATAIDGLGVGLALILKVVPEEEMPDNVKDLLNVQRERNDG